MRFCCAMLLVGLLVSTTSAQDPAAPGQAPAAEAPAADENTAPPAKPEGPVARASYAIGLQIGQHYHEQPIEFDMVALIAGLTAGLKGQKPALSEEEMKTALAEVEKTLRAKHVEARTKMAVENKRQGAEFLAANAKKEGVMTLPSGLQYKELRAGDGAKPKEFDRVVVHYRGTLIDGTEFDSSYARQEPLAIPVNGVIKGWTEALMMMPVGSKWQLFIPAELAYGEEGGGQTIPPNAALIFEVELLGIKE